MLRNLLLVVLAGATQVAADEIADDLAKVRSAAAEMGVSADAQQAWRRLSEADARQLPTLLAGMDGTGTLSQNWVRAAVDAVAERQLRSGGSLPTAELEALITDTSHSPRARRTAFEWLTKVAPEAKPRLLVAMLNDPSMSLRYDAVAAQLEKLKQGDDPGPLQQLLISARDLQQVESIAEKLTELGEEVDVPGTLGFLKNWQVIGPFDNTAMKHFDTNYPPETEQLLAQAYAGKKGEVAWQPATAEADEGFVDLIEPLGKEKEAVAYGYATFLADAGDAQVRYQSGNATKVWLNGQLIASNEVYHTGGGFDQYVANVTLQPGENELLIKACQNEQKMPWERDWNFRLRVVDKLGTPIARQPSDTTQASTE